MMAMESNKENESSQEYQAKMKALKNQVTSVQAIMVENVDRILERGERLDNIERRTEQLNITSANFKMTARKVQRKFCMLNAKWTIILTILVVVIFVVLLILILHWSGVIGSKKNN